jgi:hypothetical protein
MALSSIFLLAIVFYLLYRFVFYFLVPVAKATKQVKQQFRDMHDRMQGGAFGDASQPSSSSPKNERHTGSKGGEYIDFEEVNKK